MLNHPDMTGQHWCIVVADEHGPGGFSHSDPAPLPVQYSNLGKEGTPLQLALRRAASIAPAGCGADPARRLETNRRSVDTLVQSTQRR